MRQNTGYARGSGTSNVNLTLRAEGYTVIRGAGVSPPSWGIQERSPPRPRNQSFGNLRMIHPSTE